MMREDKNALTPATEIAPSIRGRAAQLYCERLRRNEQFDSGLFWEPSWDLLLYLFNAHEEGCDSVPLSKATRACGAVSSASATRWINLLIAKDYVATETAPAARLRLTEKGRTSMERYFHTSMALADNA